MFQASTLGRVTEIEAVRRTTTVAAMRRPALRAYCTAEARSGPRDRCVTTLNSKWSEREGSNAGSHVGESVRRSWM